MAHNNQSKVDHSLLTWASLLKSLTCGYSIAVKKMVFNSLQLLKKLYYLFCLTYVTLSNLLFYLQDTGENEKVVRWLFCYWTITLYSRTWF